MTGISTRRRERRERARSPSRARSSSITLKPLDKNAAVGDLITYTATGHLSDGNTKNLTQKVVYASSDTSVAICPNADGNKSQVQAVGVGVAIDQRDRPGDATSRPTPKAVARSPSAAGCHRDRPTPTPTPRAPQPSAAIRTLGDGDGRPTGSRCWPRRRASPSGCMPAICDVDASGAVTVTDGVLVLRAAAGLGTGSPAHSTCGGGAGGRCSAATSRQVRPRASPKRGENHS